jgi:zinc protease
MMLRRLVVPARALIAVALVFFGSEVQTLAGDQPTSFTMPNGLRVRLVPIRGEKGVAVLLGVRAGFFDEPSGSPHLAHVTEHLVVFASPTQSDEGKAVARWYGAGKANAETLPGFMYFDLHVEPDELDTALRVQAARLTRPEFTDAILRREIPRTLAELEYLEKPETYGTGKFAHSAFVQAVLHGRAEVPIKLRTRTITVEDVRRFHARTFRVDRAMLAIIGGFDPARASEAVEDAFGVIPRPATPPALLPVTRIDGPVDVRWDASTRHLILAWRTPLASDPDHAALTLAATALTGRLATDRDLSALAKSPVVTNEVEGFFLVGVQVKPGSDRDALRSKLLDQIGSLAKPEGFGDAEVDRARREFSATIAPSPLRMLVASARTAPLTVRTNVELQRMARGIVWGDLDAYVRRVEALDGVRVRDAVARLLHPDRAIVVHIEPMP